MGQKTPNWYFIYQKLIEKLVFYVPMLIERWKSKVKILLLGELFVYETILSKFEVLTQCGSKKGPTTITSQRESKVWGGIPGFCNVQKLTWEMNFFSQIFYGYWFDLSITVSAQFTNSDPFWPKFEAIT